MGFYGDKLSMSACGGSFHKFCLMNPGRTSMKVSYVMGIPPVLINVFGFSMINHPVTHRIHGAGIYANMNGVY